MIRRFKKSSKALISLLLATTMNASLLSTAYATDYTEVYNKTLDLSYTTTTEIQDWGAAITKVTVYLGGIVKIGAIDNDTFKVEVKRYDERLGDKSFLESGQRKIINSYVSDKDGNAIDKGEYVTLEMEIGPQITLSSPLNYANGSNEWINCDYTITQVKDIEGEEGIIKDVITDKYNGGVRVLVDKFETDKGNYDNIEMSYAHFSPKEDGVKNPLIIWLHGGGEGGTDATIPLSANKAANYASDEIQEIFGGAYVLAPQAPTYWMQTKDGIAGTSYYTQAVLELIDEYVAGNSDIDTNRIYVGGCSNGGYMTEILLNERTNYFAAGFPICGATSTPNEEYLKNVMKTPTWWTAAEGDSFGILAAKRYEQLIELGSDNAILSLFPNVSDTSGLYKKEDGTPYEYNPHWSWMYVHNNECINEFNGKKVTIMEWLASQSLESKEDDLTNIFLSGNVIDDQNNTLSYRYVDPVRLGLEEESYPLVVFLHGEKGIGNNNEEQLKESNGIKWFTDEDHLKKNPTYVFAPQTTENSWIEEDTYNLVMKGLDEFIDANPKVDENRIYLVGHDMGGSGVWNYLLKNPTKFAAAVPVSGKVDDKYYENNGSQIESIINVPIWTAHSQDDDVLSIENTDKIVNILKEKGNNTIKYYNYNPDSIKPSHEAWKEVYNDEEIYTWIFEQNSSRTNYGEFSPKTLFTQKDLGNGVKVIYDYDVDPMYVLENGNKAVIIDTGMGGGDLYGYMVNEVLENKNAEIDVLITHSHGDHIGDLASFVGKEQVKNIYVGEEDKNSIINIMEKDSYKVVTLKENQDIQFGDNTIGSIHVPGHSLGSTVFEYKNNLFIGDAIGTGYVWMQFGTYAIEKYVDSLQNFVDIIEGKEFILMGGHAQNREVLTNQYIHDMLECTKRVVSGTISSKKYLRGFWTSARMATYGTASLIYNPDKIYNSDFESITDNYNAVDYFYPATIINEKGQSMQYRYFNPEKVGAVQDKYPLVLFLHGEDGIGTDNKSQITANNGATVWVEKNLLDKNPTFVLAPQISGSDWTTDENTELIMEMLNEFIKNNKVDVNRIYVQGISSGANGVWNLALKYPEIFAAAVPMAGAIPSKYYEIENSFEKIANMPIWAFHAADDNIVSVDETKKAVAAIKKVGGTAIKFEEYSAGSCEESHKVWEKAYSSGTLYNWLFQQTIERTNKNSLNPSMMFTKKALSDGITVVEDYELGKIYVADQGDKALIIDTGMGGFGSADLYSYIRDNVLSNKEAMLDIIITHNHGDHILGLPSLMASNKVNKIYIHELDSEGLYKTMDKFNVNIAKDKVEFVKDGDKILVGNANFEIVEVKGHTPGSIVAFYNNYIFTGDAVGSGDLWMLSDTIQNYMSSVEKFVNEIKRRGGDFELLTGHDENFEPFTCEYVENMLECVKGILDGSIEPTIYTRRVGLYATYKNANIFYNEDMIYNKASWLEVNGNKYYINENGQKVTGWNKIDGIWYYMDENGILQAEWTGNHVDDNNKPDNGSSSVGDKNNNINSGNKLPNTGGVSSGVFGLIGVLVSIVGTTLFKKRIE